MNGYLVSLDNLSERESHVRALEQKNGDVAISCASNGSFLVVDGYVASGLGLDPTRNQEKNCEALHQVLQHHQAQGDLDALVNSLRGSYSLLLIEPTSNTVTAITDHVASRPIYVWQDTHRLLLSSKAVEIAAVRRSSEIDLGGLASFFLYGTQVEPTRTYLKGIGSQPEGSIVTYCPGLQPKVKTWYRFQHRPEVGKTIRQWSVEGAKVLTEAADRIGKISGNPLLFLSGGVDSRLAATAFVAAGTRPLLVSLADSDNLELRVARMVGRALGCRHEVHYRDSEYYLRSLNRSGASSNASHLWTHGHFSEAYAALQAREPVDGAMLGDLCEAFSKLCFSPPEDSRGWDPSAFSRNFDSFPLPNYRPKNRAQTLMLFTPEARAAALETLQARIADRFEAAREVSDDPNAVGDFFFRWQRASCHATFQMFFDVRTAGPERNVMFDRDVHSLLERLPTDLRSGKRLGARIIQQLHPLAASLPDANTLVPLLLPGFLHHWSKKLRPMLGKLKRRFLSDTYHTTASWPHLPLLMQRDLGWRSAIEDLLFNSPLTTLPELSAESIRGAWQRFSDGDLQQHENIEKLLGLAVTLRMVR